MKPHGFPSGRGARVGPDFSLKSQIPGLKIREFMVYVPGGSDKSAIMNKEREIRGGSPRVRPGRSISAMR